MKVHTNDQEFSDAKDASGWMFSAHGEVDALAKRLESGLIKAIPDLVQEAITFRGHEIVEDFSKRALVTVLDEIKESLGDENAASLLYGESPVIEVRLFENLYVAIKLEEVLPELATPMVKVGDPHDGHEAQRAKGQYVDFLRRIADLIESA